MDEGTLDRLRMAQGALYPLAGGLPAPTAHRAILAPLRRLASRLKKEPEDGSRDCCPDERVPPTDNGDR